MPDRRQAPQLVTLTGSDGERSRRPRRSGVEESAYSLRPRGAGRLLDLGIEVLVRRFLVCVGLGVALVFPLRAVMPYYQSIMSGWGARPDQLAWFLWTTVALLLAQALVDVLATTAVTLLAYEELLGGRLSVGETLRRTLGRLPALIVIFVLKALIVGIGAALLFALSVMCPPIVLGALAYYLFFQWKLAVAPSALILERIGVIAAISRSFELSRRSFLRYFALIVLSTVLGAGFSLLLAFGDHPLVTQEIVDSSGIPEPLLQGVEVVLAALFQGIVTAIGAVSITVYYLDARIRREGFDLSMRLERLRVGRVAPRGEPA